METIRESGSNGESNSTFWQAYIIMTAAILGPIAWLAWAFLLYVLEQKRVEWIKEDSARLVALAAEDPLMWCSGTKLNGLPALRSLPIYKPSLAGVSSCTENPCDGDLEFVEEKESFQCSQCLETQESPCWFSDKHQARWCMACSPPPCECSQCSTEKLAVPAHRHRLALCLSPFRSAAASSQRCAGSMGLTYGLTTFALTVSQRRGQLDSCRGATPLLKPQRRSPHRPCHPSIQNSNSRLSSPWPGLVVASSP